MRTAGSVLLLTFAFTALAGVTMLRGVPLRYPETVTVTGFADKQQGNEVASFYAGVNAGNADKQAAIDEVNTKMDEVIAALKEFGVEEKDIKTQNMSVFQEQESFSEGGAQRFRPGQWRANNSVQVTLRDVSKASDLYGVISQTGVTDISGPNFMVDTSTYENQPELMQAAVQNAREKAETLAASSGRQVGNVVTISEGSAGGPVMPFALREGAGGGGAPSMPGTSTVSSSVTVVFELR